MLNVRYLSKLAVGLTVLYVEDEKEVRETIVLILESIFENILVASNGVEGIELSKNNKIDLIISDINMPKCNGLEMIKSIKEIHPQIPTILVTALENTDLLIQSINLGINKYIVKPMKREDLFEAIEDILYILDSKRKYKSEQLSISKNLKMIAISKLLANLTHQWRQSLNIISTNTGAVMIYEDLQVKDPQIQSLLNNIETTVIGMDKQFQDILLDFEKEHKKERFNIQEVISNVIEEFKDDFSKYEVKIINNVEASWHFNNLDSLIQVIHQIIENSVDALKISNVKNRYIQISTKDEDDEFIVDIIDNGGGISSTIKDEMFEPYSTTKHQYIGTGLGLYIAYTLATKSLQGTLVGTNIIQDNQECAKLSIILLK